MELKNQYIFNSINELITELDESKEQNRSNSSDSERDKDWCDTSSYEEARKYMLEGKLYDKLNIDINKYRTKGTAQKRINRLSVQGHNVVVPLYLQSIPNNMINNKKVINNKIITIFYSVQAPHWVDKKDLEDGAIKLFKNIISLEEQGYRVNLYIIEVNADYDGKWGFSLKLKSDRETLNIKKLCFPIISSSFLRRIGFRIKERLYKDWIGSGYGSGRFEKDTTDKFIKNNLKIRNYEIWNYEGKQN